jgi:hypothetical protein
LANKKGQPGLLLVDFPCRKPVVWEKAVLALLCSGAKQLTRPRQVEHWGKVVDLQVAGKAGNPPGGGKFQISEIITTYVK